MPRFRFTFVEQGCPDWHREFDCADEPAAVLEARQLLAHQLLLRPAAPLRLTVAREDGALLGWVAPGGVFTSGPLPPTAGA